MDFLHQPHPHPWKSNIRFNANMNCTHTGYWLDTGDTKVSSRVTVPAVTEPLGEQRGVGSVTVGTHPYHTHTDFIPCVPPREADGKGESETIIASGVLDLNSQTSAKEK